MTYRIGIRPTGTRNYGGHDPSVVIFNGSNLLFAAEEERFTREKHASNTFPKQSLIAGLERVGIELCDVSEILLSYDRTREPYLRPFLKDHIESQNGVLSKVGLIKTQIREAIEDAIEKKYSSSDEIFHDIRSELRSVGSPVPPIKARIHHNCHAASAFHVSPFDEALVLTIDGRGENESTVVWDANSDGLDRLQSYEYPNSLGRFFGGITKYLGFREKNGEGKVMGLAPYGSPNKKIRSVLLDEIEIGPDYDVTSLIKGGYEGTVKKLEELFERPRQQTTSEFDDWCKDLAYVVQSILEEIVCSIVSTNLPKVNTGNVGLAGGVALNCKMNKKVMEVDDVDEVFIQPAAHDAGVALGAVLLELEPDSVSEMESVYSGTEYPMPEIREILNRNKIYYEEPDELEKEIAKYIADGKIIGWYQNRMEFGPRALGNRSILADPRSIKSRDKVNKYVKHREEWRPFAPSLLEEHAGEFLKDYESSSFMIKTFNTTKKATDSIPAVLHPADNTTRPQTVSKEVNERYWNLISEFSKITGVPVLLNTSFNDHGEPIVENPKDALRSFYGMGLDILVLGDYVIKKEVC